MQKTKTLSQLKKTITQSQGEHGTTAYRPKGEDEKNFFDQHKIEVIDDANGNGDEVFKGTGVKVIDRKTERHGYDHEEGKKAYDLKFGKLASQAQTNEETKLDERTLSSGEMKDREDIVKGMKKNLSGFKSKYGKDAKSVMYATATKLAKEEVESDIDTSLLEYWLTLDQEEQAMVAEMVEKGLDDELIEFLTSEEDNG